MSETAIQSISSLIRLEHYEQAEALCLKNLKLEVDAHIFCTLLGEIYLRQGRSIEAQLFFEKAIELESAYEPARYGLEQIDIFISLIKLPTGIIVQKYNDEELSNEQILTLYRMLRETERRREIIENIKNKVQVTEKNWRTIWFFAGEAKFYEQYEAVDVLCEHILKLHPDFLYATELPKHTRGFYAPSDLDNFLEEFFEENPVEGRVFLDVGSFDGTFHSQVRRLYEVSGWSGICIEPEPQSFSELEAIYTDGLVQCFNYEMAESDTIAPRFAVPVKTLTAVLEETGTRAIDFLSVNTSGQALSILSGLNFKKYAPSLVAIKVSEDNNTTERIMAKHGYEVIHQATNYIYYTRTDQKNAESNEQLPVFGVRGHAGEQKKLIALVPSVGFTPYFDVFVHSLALFTDAIILQKSPVNQRRPLLSKETIEDCQIVGILESSQQEPLYEVLDKMLLLGRRKRGTHFIVVYPGEIISANMLENQLFRNSALELEPGESLSFPVVAIKNGLKDYYAEHEKGGSFQKVLFADDGVAIYDKNPTNDDRLPSGLRGYNYRLEGTRFCLLDSKYANDENIRIGIAWEKFAQQTGHDAMPIALNEMVHTDVLLEPGLPEWFTDNAYCNEEAFLIPDAVSLRNIYSWFNEYGLDFFKDVDDSGLDWRKYSALATSTPAIVEEIEPEREKDQRTEMMLLDVESALHKQNFELAEELLAELLMDDPSNFEALNSFAVLKILMEEFDVAGEILKQILAIDPANEIALENLTYLRRIGKV
ncbi:MAG: hypothetical protein HYV28_14840 [Ignavibacteriales bacterium]|nr:hypothetical protein [Ignavibacteriales bacterium]